MTDRPLRLMGTAGRPPKSTSGALNGKAELSTLLKLQEGHCSVKQLQLLWPVVVAAASFIYRYTPFLSSSMGSCCLLPSFLFPQTHVFGPSERKPQAGDAALQQLPEMWISGGK